jgi:hypothetical protein
MHYRSIPFDRQGGSASTGHLYTGLFPKEAAALDTYFVCEIILPHSGTAP